MGFAALRSGLVVLALAAAGCGSTIRAASTEVPRTATPVFADAALGVLETQSTRQRIDAVLGTPEMQHAIAELGAGLVHGVGDGLSDEAAQARIDELASRFSRALAAEIPRTIEPAMQKALADGLGVAIHDAIQRELGPGLVATMRSPEFKQALGETSREIGRDAVMGSNDALTEIAGRKQTGRPGILGVVGALIESRWILGILVALAIVVFPLVWLLRNRVKARRNRAVSDRRSDELGVLVHALEALGDRATPADVVALLKEQLQAARDEHPSTQGRRASANGAHHA